MASNHTNFDVPLLCVFFLFVCIFAVAVAVPLSPLCILFFFFPLPFALQPTVLLWKRNSPAKPLHLTSYQSLHLDFFPSSFLSSSFSLLAFDFSLFSSHFLYPLVSFFGSESSVLTIPFIFHVTLSTFNDSH
jgi:hypothetical protein